MSNPSLNMGMSICFVLYPSRPFRKYTGRSVSTAGPCHHHGNWQRWQQNGQYFKHYSSNSSYTKSTCSDIHYIKDGHRYTKKGLEMGPTHVIFSIDFILLLAKFKRFLSRLLVYEDVYKSMLDYKSGTAEIK